MSAMNLRGLIRQVLGDSPETDPDALAPVVFKQIDAADRDDALMQALRSLVREVMSQERMRNPIAPASVTRPFGASTAPAPRSWKVSRIREGWQAALKTRVLGDGGWKFLADCTRDDLLFAAGQRRQAADRSNAIAKNFDALAQLLIEHGAETVAQLPTEILMVAIGAQAA